MTKKVIFNKNALFKKNPHIQTIRTDEGIIISRSDLKDGIIYYLDNPVSFRIWDLINKKKSLKEIKQNLLSEYDVTEKKLNKDTDKFIKDLYLKKLITNI